MSTMHLCFYGNGPYWTDFIYLPSLPHGVSYVHEFRYSESLVQDLVKQKISDQNDSFSLSGQSLIIGARFNPPSRKDEEPQSLAPNIHEYERFVLPIRAATCIEAVRTAGVYQIYFRLGPLFDFRKIPDILNATYKMTDQEVIDARGKLAFFMAPKNPKPEVDTYDAENDAWADFVHRIARSDTVPINPQAKRSLYFRVKTPTRVDNGASADVGLILKSATQPDTYGFLLQEGREYEIPIHYQFPSLTKIGTSPGEIDVPVSCASDKVVLGENALRLVGNYGSSVLHLASDYVVKPSAVRLAPPEIIKPQDGSENINARGLAFYLIFERNLPLRLWRNIGGWLLVFVSLFVISSMAVVNQILPQIFAGKLEVTSNMVLMWIIGLAFSALAATAIKTKEKS